MKTSTSSMAIIAAVCLGVAITAQAADYDSQNQKAGRSSDQIQNQQSQNNNMSANGAGLLFSRNIIGQAVRNNEGQEIGHVRELVIDEDGQVQFGIIEVGKGFLGIGNKKIQIPWSDLALSATEQGYRLNVSKEALTKTPEYQITEVAPTQTGATGEYRRMSRESSTYQGKVVALDRENGKVTVSQGLVNHDFKLSESAWNTNVKVGEEVKVTYAKVKGENIAQSIQQITRQDQPTEQPIPQPSK